MGNTLAKYCKADWVDGGRVREKASEDERPIMVDAWGAPIYAPKDYDTHLVKKLIRQRRLAPFYAAEEEATDNNGGDSSGSDDSFTTSKRTRRKVKKNKPNKDDPESIESSYFSEELLQEGFLDCPICLLAYPRNTNYTECCHQPMCTSCFVKIKRPNSGRVISCPFCNHANFSVLYHKPRWLAELAKEESLRDASVKPDPVACESIKSVVPAHERIQRLHANGHRSQTQPRYYYANRGRSGGAVPPRRYVFYEPSGSYTFYDNQYYRAPSAPEDPNPSYYQHYRQQEYQRQQALRARAESYERQQLEEAIRRSMNESSANE